MSIKSYCFIQSARGTDFAYGLQGFNVYIYKTLKHYIYIYISLEHSKYGRPKIMVNTYTI